MVAVENIILAAVTVFSLALTVISLMAWRRSRDPHLLFLVGAFLVFAAKGLFLSTTIFLGWTDLAQLIVLSGFLDMAILALFYGFTLRR